MVEFRFKQTRRIVLNQQKEMIEILNISRQRLTKLPYVKDAEDALARKISPPSKGREGVIMIERDGIRYISIKEAASIRRCSIETIYRKIRKQELVSVSYRGTFFVPMELFQHANQF